MSNLRKALSWLTGGVLVIAAVALSTGTAQAGVPCNPIAQGDYVHESSNQASGHGWWLKNNRKDNSAEVSVVLWEKWVSDGRWHDMGSETWAVMPGGGSVARVTTKGGL